MSKKRKFQPKSGFGQGAVLLIQRYYDHDVGRDSAALSYYLLFAIFPLLIFVSALLGALHLDVASITKLLERLVPADVVSVAEAYLTYVSSNTSRQLLWFSLVFSIWFPMRATSSLMHSVRKAYGLGQPRNAIFSQLRILLFTVWMIVTIALVLVLVTVGRRVLSFVAGLIYVSAEFINVWSYIRFVILGVYMFISLALLYLLSQGRKRPLREAMPGAGLSLCVWMALSLGFSFYVERMAHYAELYGSIATIIVVLLWLYMSGMVMIMGAEFNGVVLEIKDRRVKRRLAEKIEEERNQST
ncbi:MAG: YihY/virulence factor BrkB family protein [Clostridiales bacterium]|nr:YihY/virulence factor BrkB family protein [Clostridiales bacterium]